VFDGSWDILLVNFMSLARITRVVGTFPKLLDLPNSNKLAQIYYFAGESDIIWLESLSEDSIYLSDIREAIYFVAEDLIYQLGV